MIRAVVFSSLALLGVATFGCSSSDGAAAPGDGGDETAEVSSDAKLDTRRDVAVDTQLPPECPPIGSTCPPDAFIGCASDWPGVDRRECHDGRWCAVPGTPRPSNAACPATPPAGGSTCTPSDGPSGYEYCAYHCSDGADHAIVCAAGIWCGDVLTGCTLVLATDAGSDAPTDSPTDAPDAVDAPDVIDASDAIDAGDASDASDGG